MFLRLILKNKFLGLIITKIPSLCFHVKPFMVSSVKQHQVITKDRKGKKNKEKNMWNFEKYATPIGGLRCDLVSEDYERIRARWFWRLWVPLQRNVLDLWQEHILWIDPYKRSHFKIHDIFGYMVICKYSSSKSGCVRRMFYMFLHKKIKLNCW